MLQGRSVLHASLHGYLINAPEQTLSAQCMQAAVALARIEAQVTSPSDPPFPEARSDGAGMSVSEEQTDCSGPQCTAPKSSDARCPKLDASYG